MVDNKRRYISDWKPISELRLVQRPISNWGYRKEYIDRNRLNETKRPHWSNSITGVINFFEPIEVKMENGNIYFRQNENHIRMKEPETFTTQFGVFNNHNHGEFESWLGKDGYNGLPEKERELHRLFGRTDYFIEGNYCDMFDCGIFSYAISNLMHFGLGHFKIIQINKNLEVVTLYNNQNGSDHTRLHYLGYFKKDQGYILVASGVRVLSQDEKERNDITILFQIDENGESYIKNELCVEISSSNSMVVDGDNVFFGQNKMVTRLNIATGKVSYFTNKSEEELAALVKMF